MTTNWGNGGKIKPWPKPGPDEPIVLYNAEWQDFDGSWNVLAAAVPVKHALRIVRDYRRTFAYPHYPPETRVHESRKEGLK